MLTYLNSGMAEPKSFSAKSQESLKNSLWIDLLAPTRAEEDLVEKFIGEDIPTRDEMVEIELSSRLYRDEDAIFMTAMMISNSDSPEPKLDPVTFVLTSKQLITIRYIESQSFRLFLAKVKKLETIKISSINLFTELLDAIVDRLADILEIAGSRVDLYSKTIFMPQSKSAEKLDYRKLMQEIGVNADLNTKVRESLVTFSRLVTFFGQSTLLKIDKAQQLRIASLSADITSLSDYANFLSTKINFLLDATLGMVNIEQNNIIKIFSVAAVIFLPPTLVASIYGMNFHFMPELSWKYGYMFAVSMILFAAWVPYKYFKYRKWL